MHYHWKQENSGKIGLCHISNVMINRLKYLNSGEILRDTLGWEGYHIANNVTGGIAKKSNDFIFSTTFSSFEDDLEL